MLVELMYFLLGTIAVIGTMMLLTVACVLFFKFMLVLLEQVFIDYHQCKKAYLGPTVEKPKILPPPPPIHRDMMGGGGLHPMNPGPSRPAAHCIYEKISEMGNNK